MAAGLQASGVVERPAGATEQAVAGGGFCTIVPRGEMAFSRSDKRDAWDDDGVTFYFGFPAKKNLEQIAAERPKTA